MDEAAPEDIQLSSFEHEKEFLLVLNNFLEENAQNNPLMAVGNASSPQMSRLTYILDLYQEQPYILDPFLGKMVDPVVEELKKVIRDVTKLDEISTEKITRLHQLSTLIYWYSKTRGTKSIVPFFPHAVQDLPLALNFAEQKESFLFETESWALRYVTAMWLSLICMIPFDLARFDEPGTSPERLVAQRLDRIGKSYLSYPGIERESAAMLLARLYMRTDMLAHIPHHLGWSIRRIREGANTFEVIGIMQVAAMMMKAGGAGLVLPYIDQFQELIEVVGSTTTSTNINLLTNALMKDTLVRKYRIKLIVRLAMCELPGKPRKVNIQYRKLVLQTVRADTNDANDDYDPPIPESIEGVIEQLITGAQDQDTSVRYSSAKGIARVASRLPEAFSDEIVDAVTSLFSIHGTVLADLPPAAEGTWHGASLACAELARRGLISASRIKEVVEWICKALSFDVRKGAHSVGSSVRDSASYVLWALVRAQSVDILAPHLLEIARRLVIASLFDREVHVRRAASAAYQEAVGRTRSIPHGIDVLRENDFHAVSVRRSAFLVAAPQIAIFSEYQQPLIDHVIQTTLRHWDPKIRTLGAQALRLICAVNLKALGSQAASTLSVRLRSMDTNDVHGALLGLAEIAKALGEENLEEERLQCFKYLSTLPSSTYQKFRGDLIMEAACLLVAESISPAALSLPSTQGLHDWRDIVINSGMKHQSETVQFAATLAMSAVSRLIDCTQEVRLFVKDFQAKNASPTTQCSVSQVLGALAYDKFGHDLDNAVDCLIGGITKDSESYCKPVEARRNCITSLADLAVHVLKTSPSTLDSKSSQIYASILLGFEDYSVDQRGDVGSWVRIAALRAVTFISRALFSRRGNVKRFESYLPPNLWLKAIGGILKQGVERLDNVRAVAGEQMRTILLDPIVRESASDDWAIPGVDLLRAAFPLTEPHPWNDGDWLFPRIPPLLHIKDYRDVLLSGIITSLGSRNESAQLPLANALCDYANGLPVTPEPKNTEGTWHLLGFIDSVVDIGRTRVAVNTIMIPVLKTIDILFGGEVLKRLCSDEDGAKRLNSALDLAGKGADRMKNMERIVAAMKVTVDCVALPPVSKVACGYVASFLSHRFPKVSADTAEALYLLIQTQDLVESEELEELLLETSWMNINDADRAQKSRDVLSLLHTIIEG